MQIGGSDSSVEVTADKIMERAQEFAPSVAGNKAAPFTIGVMDYTTLSGLPPLPNKHDLLLAKDVVRECGRLRLRYLDWINDLEYVLAHPSQFDWSNEKQQTLRLGAKLDELREAITMLSRQASKCANNLSECEMPTGKATVILDPDAIPDRRARAKRPSGKPIRVGDGRPGSRETFAMLAREHRRSVEELVDAARNGKRVVASHAESPVAARHGKPVVASHGKPVAGNQGKPIR